MAVPDQPKIYHIVHVDRLESIVTDGFLWCDAVVVQRQSAGEPRAAGVSRWTRSDRACNPLWAEARNLARRALDALSIDLGAPDSRYI
ncbi:MAG: DUF4433 domain-containing protein [Planctomycetes bacterium]|nr:DUF4433 domain-containing protein [Planctomycetota bacterium]